MITISELLLELLTLVLHLLREALPQDHHIRALAVDLLETRLELLYTDLSVLEAMREAIALGGGGVEGVLLICQ